MARASFTAYFSSTIVLLSTIASIHSTSAVKTPLEILEVLNTSSGHAELLHQNDDDNELQVFDLVKTNNTVHLNKTEASHAPLTDPQNGPEIPVNNEAHVIQEVSEFTTNIHNDVTDLTNKIQNHVTKFTTNINRKMTKLTANLQNTSWAENEGIKIENSNFKVKITVNGKPVDFPGTDIYNEIWRSVGEDIVALFPALWWLRPKEKDPIQQGTSGLQFISGIFRTLWYALYIIPVLNQLVFGLLGVAAGLCIFLVVLA